MNKLAKVSLLLLICVTIHVHEARIQRKAGGTPVDRRRADTIITKFGLYKGQSSNSETCYITPHRAETLDNCAFNSSHSLVMIIHGWTVDGVHENWTWKMAAALKLKLKDVNVIVVDWLILAHQHYPTAVKNTRVVGQDIADLLDWLEEFFQVPKGKVHLIGYSLGAHVSGFAGSYITGPTKIGRITGLDPAGPLFEGMSSTERLSPDDASFVDALHTFTQEHMGLSVGINQPVAHYDFYPNGGTFQPGCHIKHVYNHIATYGILGITETVKCAHERSVHLFIDSLLNEDKQSIAYWCNDLSTFNKGICLSCRKNRCNTMGYNIKKVRTQRSKKMFLNTRANMPYKVYHYQFKINFINQTEHPNLEPFLKVSLYGTEGDAENVPIKLFESIKTNKTYSFLIYTDVNIGDLMMLKFKWENSVAWANLLRTVQTYFPWGQNNINPELIVRRIRVKAGETQHKVTFCSLNTINMHFQPAQEKTFVRCIGKTRRRHRRLK
ncbi:hepatic triacylglycerol lipase [Leucoraja erinacea]|uniref:hepatic triacylglycerol lipase n=1 Tax=Leucoraja erinaceus TaxID=7782 RepID=UPI002455C610|nr:hepatic triacylglycerol lipase [Leucoraja erinacea]